MKKTPIHAFTITMIVLVFAWLMIERAKAESVKIGEGPFVMAVSYTESYDDLQYIANFANCDQALDYYNLNCVKAKIMMCQAEDRMYMPIDHDTSNEFSSFDFEIDTTQSCGDTFKSTFTEK
jgi:hypothetical protein